MKIQCPNCKITGQISDAKVPAEGIMMNCPKCKTPFRVKRDAASGWQSGDCMSICPGCNYSTFTDETFDICPKCGLVAREYNAKLRDKSQREERTREEERLRLEEEQALRKYGIIEDVPKAQAEAPVMADIPPAIQFAGWTVVAVALLLLIFGCKGLYVFYAVSSMEAADPSTLEEPRTAAALFLEFGLLPAFQTVFGAVALVAGSQFLKLRGWARNALEWAAWAGLVFMSGYELFNLVAWIRRSSSTPTISYYAVGILSALGMLAVWIAPLFFLIRFLRGSTVKKAVV